jgi:3-hydroxybutyryl-CoA dehydrogenase
MQVIVVGVGRMGAQIGVEHALGGHDVSFVARRPEAARERVAHGFALVEQFALRPAGDVGAARARIEIVDAIEWLETPADLVVESVIEEFDAKVEVLGRAAHRWPGAILASNTSSLSVTALGAAIAAGGRMVGTHYWNPPLLMPLVEVIRGQDTVPEVVDRVVAELRALGKRPVVVEREVPGFVWNRLQLALLREAVWLVAQGVATPATIDEIVRDGLGRRWRYTGPFQTAALGGAETFERIANNLWPVLSDATVLTDLRRWLDEDPATLDGLRSSRDAGLRRDLARDLAQGAGGAG